jgi:PDZ domain
MRKLTSIIVVTLLGGCVTHTFVPGPGMSAIDFEPDSAQCRLFSRGAQTGFAFGASGSPQYVGAAMGGAALGYAIGSAVEKNQNFNDCMQAHGWRVADGQSTSDASMVGKLAPTEIPIVLASNSMPATRKPLLIRATTVTPSMIEVEHLDPIRGVVILSVGIGGAARAAGLVEHDVILDFNGSPVHGETDMQRMLAGIAPNSTVIATIWRDGREKSIEVQF